MLEFEIKKAVKQVLQVDNSTFLAVDFDIIDVETKEILTTRSLAFKPEQTADEIKTELAKYVVNYQAELDLKADNEEQEKVEKQADDTIGELLGK